MKIKPEHNYMYNLLQLFLSCGRSEPKATKDPRGVLKEVFAAPNYSNNAKYKQLGHGKGAIISA